MLKDEDRIFQNLYNDKGSDVESSKKRGDWIGTTDIIKREESGLLMRSKLQNLEEEEVLDFPLG